MLAADKKLADQAAQAGRQPLTAEFRVAGHGNPAVFGHDLPAVMKGGRYLHLPVVIPAALPIAVLHGRAQYLLGHLEPFLDDHFEILQAEILVAFVFQQVRHIEVFKQYKLGVSFIPIEIIYSHGLISFFLLDLKILGFSTSPW